MTSPPASSLVRIITLRQMQLFETVVRLGGYTRAAEELNLSQPTVSMQVKKLCESLGLELLEQVGKHCYPTDTGREVYDTICDILDRLSALDDLANSVKGEITGELRIAVITTAKYFMPHFLGRFIDLYPNVHPRLTVTNRDSVLQRLKTSRDDLLIMGQVPQNLPVTSHQLMDNEIVVVAKPDHPLVGQSRISLQRLSRERQLVREPGSGTRQAVDRLFQKQGITITPYMELSSSEAIKQAVMAGLGISVLAKRNLRLELAGNHIAILDTQSFPLVRSWYAVHLRDKKLSLVARTFLSFVIEESDGP